MARCGTVRRNLTTWIDGELSNWRSGRIQRHLSNCPSCRAEAEQLRADVQWQARALSAAIAVTEVDSQALRLRLQRALAAEPEAHGVDWNWLLRPFVAAAMALTLGLVLAFSVLGGPKAVLMPLGIEAPPVAVTREPELFEDYQLIRNLDELENFDTVESEPLDDDQVLHQG